MQRQKSRLVWLVWVAAFCRRVFGGAVPVERFMSCTSAGEGARSADGPGWLLLMNAGHVCCHALGKEKMGDVAGCKEVLLSMRLVCHPLPQQCPLSWR